jgi:CMP-N,N'-diacetyllegionaminic acid synthase
MIRGQSVLGVIPARGGSRGVPRKNIRVIAGKPLIAWTILEAKKSKYIDRLILSSEDEAIISVSRTWDCEVPFTRPAELSRNETPGIEPLLHALKALPEKYDYIALLQPTSPLRLAKDIDDCIRMCISGGAKACVSVVEAEKSPYWMYKISESRRLEPIIGKEAGYVTSRRQDLPKVYALNGAVYVARTDWLQQYRSFLSSDTLAYVMPRERSLDVDTELDLKICDFLLSEMEEKRKIAMERL